MKPFITPAKDTTMPLQNYLTYFKWCSNTRNVKFHNLIQELFPNSVLVRC
ncbi:hypothetical protein CoNPh26_CDS0132 [Staphylococcus phage S-CoN_Ph26]|nr:hypothetical protein CoNPh26_CDS0132 [Staphylococcus phage S-CoN_Ph26]